MNDITIQELEAIKAIFGSDYSLIMEPLVWGKTSKWHSLTLKARDDGEYSGGQSDNSFELASVCLRWQFPPEYPNSAPLFKLAEPKGLDKDGQATVMLIIKELSKSLIGVEQIYDIATAVIDVLTDNSNLKGSSLHDVMEKKQELKDKQSLIDMKRNKEQNERQRLEENVLLDTQVKEEISKKRKQKEKIKRNIQVPDYIPTAITIDDCNFSPPGIFKDKNFRLAWLPLSNDELYLSETFVITNEKLVKETLDRLKEFQIKHFPKIYDYKISNNDGILSCQVLTDYCHKTNLQDFLQIRDTLSLGNVSTIIAAYFSLIDDLGFPEGLYIDQDQVWFCATSQEPIFSITILSCGNSGFVKKSKYPSWNLPETSFSHLAIQICEMLAGNSDFSQFTSPIDCMSKIYRNNHIITDFLQTLLDPVAKITELQSHPFFFRENLIVSRSSIAAPREVRNDFESPKAFFEGSTFSRYKTDFEEIGFLGRGGFGSVLKCRNYVDGRFYAVKKIRLNPLDRETSKKLLREVQTLSRLHSEYIVRYYQAWFEDLDNSVPASGSSDTSDYSYSSSSNSDYDYDCHSGEDWLSSNIVSNLPSDSSSLYTQVLYIQMEYCEKKTLRDIITEGLGLDQSWNYLRQLLEGLGYLHASGLIHRDLKPSNVFFDSNMRVKIGDFGLATTKNNRTWLTAENLTQSAFKAEQDKSDSLTSQIGTPVYIAPEILSGTGKYNSKVDLYSLGIVFFEMIYKMSTGMERIMVMNGLRTVEIIFPVELEKNDDLKDARTVIRMLLDHKPRNRPSCAQLLHSPLVPLNVEDEYVNEELLRVVRQRNPMYFSKLINSLFTHVFPTHQDFAYDFNSNSIFKPLYNLLSSQMRYFAIGVFLRHGASNICCPVLLPKSYLIEEIYSNKKRAEFLDINGDVVELPHDLTYPFARALVQNSEELTFPLKRFSIDKVFRKNVVGGQPKFVEEADFDIVYEPGILSQTNAMIAEAEVLKVVFEILEFGAIHRFFNMLDFHIRLNQSSVLDFILVTAGVPASLRLSVLDALSAFRNPYSINQLRQGLSRLGLSKDMIEKIGEFDISIPISSDTPLKAFEPYMKKELALNLVKLVANLEILGISNSVTFDPLFVYNRNIYDGLIFQIVKKQKFKFDVFAAGGHYASLLDRIKNSFMNRRKLNAFGVNIAFSKFIAGISELQAQHQIDDSKHVGKPFVKAEVLLVSFGSSTAIESAKLSIAQELWSSGISLDISLGSIHSIEDLSNHKYFYNNAVILKAKANGFTIKIRSLDTKHEQEVLRGGILPLIMSSLKTVSPLPRTPAALLDADNQMKNEVLVFPAITGGGKKQRKITSPVSNSMLTEKAKAAVSVMIQRAKIIVVDLSVDELGKFANFFKNHDEKLINTSQKALYAIQVKKQIERGVDAIFFFSTIDQIAVVLGI